MKKIFVILIVSSFCIGCNDDKNPEIVELPTVNTYPVFDIETDKAKCGGIITNDGGSEISERGLCWDTLPMPTTTSNKTVSGAGNGEFTGNLDSLKPNTTYYVRAFATNSLGTSYGLQVTFETLPVNVGLSSSGGIIAYIFKFGEGNYHKDSISGLIVNLDAIERYEWGCEFNEIGVGSRQLGAGMANTKRIVQGCTTDSIAAAYCNDLVHEGYNDWFLPSYDELKVAYDYLWSQQEFSEELQTKASMLRFGDLISSSENDSEHVSAVILGLDMNAVQRKGTPSGVLPVRYFSIAK